MIAGIRPENFEDAALLAADARDRGVTFKAKVDLVESLGSEDYVYFEVESGGIESDQLADLAEDSGAHEVPSLGEGQVVARRITNGDASRGVAHAASGPCLQHNLICVLEGGE